MTVKELASKIGVVDITSKDGEVHKGTKDEKDIYILTASDGENEPKVGWIIYDDQRCDYCDKCGNIRPLHEIDFNPLTGKRFCHDCGAD